MIAIAVIAMTACSGSEGRDSAKPVEGPLSILLVNDDGWDADGITQTYRALRQEGHHVTVVAPLENQSGRSMASNVSTLEVTQPEPGNPTYAVDGTPVDALNIGLFGVLADSPPDLVISGVNLGANIAANTNYSGTVGAASAASEAGFPAIAVSADTSADGTANFPVAARTVVRLVSAVAAEGFDGLGRAGFLNVNIPAQTDSRSEPRGVRAARLAVGGPRTVKYEKSAPTTWTPTFKYNPRVGGALADAQQLADGWTTVTWLTSARTFPASRADQVDRVAERLR
jgi:5'/3'-nucleotidase SurE